MNTLVTVYILTYKNFNYLEKTVRSVAEQSYKNIELLLSDDASDNINKNEISLLLFQYKKRFTNIIVNYNEKNLGTVKHLNKVISMSTGELIMGLGADDYFATPDAVERVVKYFNENPEKLLVASKRIDKEDKGLRPRDKIINLIVNNPTKFRKVALRMSCPLIGGVGTYYKKEIFDKYGPFLEAFTLAEDVSYYLYVKMCIRDSNRYVLKLMPALISFHRKALIITE